MFMELPRDDIWYIIAMHYVQNKLDIVGSKIPLKITKRHIVMFSLS
jgi:hypothetical protein